MAVLVRTNAQLPPIEDALTRAGIEYTVRGQRFYQRPRFATRAGSSRAAEMTETGAALVEGASRALFNERLGYDAGAETAGDEAGERAASLELLLTIASDLVWVNEPPARPSCWPSSTDATRPRRPRTASASTC